LRFLIVSDIHANVTALEAVVNAAKGRWDQAICLGDVVGYGPDPNEAIDLVKTLNPTLIRGNHDKAACGQTDAEDFNPVARLAAEWTTAQLRAENMEFLKALPQGPKQVDGITLVHGAVVDEDEYIFAPAQALDSLLEAPTAVTFFGHTHFQGGFSYRDTRLEVIQLKPHRWGSRATATRARRSPWRTWGTMWLNSGECRTMWRRYRSACEEPACRSRWCCE
jgi:predicted phosphodiesterase